MKIVQDIALQSGWETFLLAVPFIGMVIIGVFRLDIILATPKCSSRKRRPPAGIGADGKILLTDPDGRSWDEKQVKSD